MTDADGRERSALRFPRVAFDFSGLILGVGAYWGYSLLWAPLASVLGVADQTLGQQTIPAASALRLEFFGTVFQKVRLPFNQVIGQIVGYNGPIVMRNAEGQTATDWTVPNLELPIWQFAVVAAVLLVFWSIAGGGLARIHALRIARDESIAVDEAVAFSMSNLRAFLLAPIFVVAATAFFVLCNLAAGALSAVPFAGPAFQLVLQPLTLLSGLIITVMVVGAFFGFPMLHAAIAAERNGFLDAVSRMFSYVFSRPLTFVTGAGIVLFVATIISQLGAWFLWVSLESFARGAGWGEGIEAAARYGFEMGQRLSFLPSERPALPAGTMWVSWGWAFIGMLAVKGTVTSYVVGGLTDVYFMLRNEVDGIPLGEIYGDDDDVSLGDPVAGQPEAAAAPAPAPDQPAE